METPEKYLELAKEQLAAKTYFKIWQNIIDELEGSREYEKDYLEKAYFLALRLQAEDYEKRHNALSVAFNDMYKKADEYYEENKRLLSQLKASVTQEKAKAFDEGVEAMKEHDYIDRPVNPYKQ